MLKGLGFQGFRDLGLRVLGLGFWAYGLVGFRAYRV